MLSYRHSFHAGNHADILKHSILALVLDYYNRKEKPYIYIDTHAGAGMYDLHSDEAQKTVEYHSGIAKLRNARIALPDVLEPLFNAIEYATHANPDSYPGSPLIAKAMMRKQDYLRLFELHPRDVQHLENALMHSPNPHIRYSIVQQDGLKGALAYLPPPNRRAIVLTDPSYEVKADYRTIPAGLEIMHNRCREACLMLWYPLLERDDIGTMKADLQQRFPHNTLTAELRICTARQQGMYGSGMFVFNPPYVLKQQLQVLLPTLVSVLGQDQTASFHI